MKHSSKILTFLFVLILAACKSTPPTPTETAQKFANAVAKGNVSDSKKYCTTATSIKLDLIYTINGVQENPKFRIMTIGEEIDGNVAYVYYKHTDRVTDYSDGYGLYEGKTLSDAEKEGAKKLKLILEGDEWKVDLSD